ncbi:MAG: ATP-binding protein, partial [Nitratireductor sp.]
WQKENKKPILMGSLDEASGAPLVDREFAAFGKWLKPEYAIKIEEAFNQLKETGQKFDLIIETQNDRALEVQGRVSGDIPFARFYEMGQERKKHADISKKHENLVSQFALVEKLFEQLPFPVWLRDKDKKLFWTNEAYAKAVECENAEQATQQNKQLFDSSERAIIDVAKAQNQFFAGELPAIIAGDRNQVQTVEIATDDGEAGIAVDRSEIDYVRTTLKETITSHSQTIENLNTAIAIFDSKQNLAFSNASFQSLWGLKTTLLEDSPSNGDILEAMRETSILPETPDWKKWKAKQLEAYRSTEPVEEQWHLTDGRTLRVIINPQNQGGTSWIFENLTEQLALKSNFNRLMRLQDETIEHLNEAVAVFGSDGKLKLTNPIFCKLWNLDEKDVEGKHIRDLSKQCVSQLNSKDTWEAILLGVTNVSDERDDMSGRVELVNGSILDYHLARLPDAQTMLTLVDMTAAANVEKALQERNDALEESDVVKTRFIQHVSYELRAPLTSIAGFSEILASNATGDLNSKQAEYVQFISQSSDVLKALIDDILDLASIDAGSLELEFEKMEIANCIQESIEAIEDKLSRHQIKVNVNIDKACSTLVADPRRIRQVIYNLLSNAVNASPDGGEVKIEITGSDNNFVIAISDQGEGVADDMKEKIFERFESHKGSQNQKGAGLGLSIVKSFVSLHGGNVHVEDAGKRGAKFVCTIPFEPTLSQKAAE